MDNLKFFFNTTIAILIISCSSSIENTADLIVYNGVVESMDSDFVDADAVAVRNGKILMVGSFDEMNALKNDSTKLINAESSYIMPGLIEGHGHFSSLGNSLYNLNFLESNSWEEIVSMVKEKAKDAKPGEWITGRGWHQEKWDSVPTLHHLEYPHHHTLSEASPYNPVVLGHASGHSLFANKAAMEKAGISRETTDPLGGAIVRNSDGDAIGVFEENAQVLIYSALSEYRNTLSEEERQQEWEKSITLAEQECLENGITSFHDAGSSFREIQQYKDLASNGELDVRLYVMIRHSADKLREQLDEFPQIGLGNNTLTIRSIKAAVDGALGSFGAWMLEPYADKPGFTGQNTTTVEELRAIADLAAVHDMQFCVHAIGDKANREVLDIFENTFAEHPGTDTMRWRIEHAQHLSVEDIPRFGKMNVIAAMQGIHCTSDAPFVEKRLGYKRAKNGAYAWRSLLDSGARIANGTDAPVEDVDPFASIYASITRKRLDSGMAFYPEQAMTRKEALQSYTIGNAYAAFEEDIKGSLTPGKVADIVILSNNLMTCPEENIPKTKVLYTISGGKVHHYTNN